MKIIKPLLLAVSILVYSGIKAQHDEDNHHTSSDTHHDEKHDTHHAHKHHIAIFGGAASNFSHHETKPGVGLDYEYRISAPFGIGAVAEVEFTDKESYLASIPVFYHPINGLKIYAGPAVLSAVEHHEAEDTHADPHTTTHVEDDPQRKTSYGGRVGAAYDLHLGKVSIGPTVSYVFGNSNALVYGINIGMGF